MGPKVVITVKTDFDLTPPGVSWQQHVINTSRANISKICALLLKDHPSLKYKASKVLPSVVVDVYELGLEELNDFLIKMRNIDFVDGAEKVNTEL